jgi:hypothetical protein
MSKTGSVIVWATGKLLAVQPVLTFVLESFCFRVPCLHRWILVFHVTAAHYHLLYVIAI